MKVVRGALGVLCALVVWELILRQAVVVNPGGYDHPVLGRLPRPGVMVSSHEGFSRTTINSLGMRGPALAAKAPGEVRILVIGDSLTAGMEVADGATYCDRLQATLAQALGRPVTVVNAGRGGASAAYYVHLAAFYQRAVDPDHTVLQLDDSDFNSDAFLPEKSFRLVAEGRGFRTVAAPPAPVAESPLARLIGLHPALGPLAGLQGGLRSSLTTAVDKLRPHLEDGATRLRGPAPAPSAPPEPDDAEVMRWALPRLIAAYRRPVILYLPHEFKPRTALEDLAAAEARARGVVCLNPRRELSRAVQAHQPPRGFNNTAPGAGHLNEHGHRLVAECLAAHFTRRLAP